MPHIPTGRFLLATCALLFAQMASAELTPRQEALIPVVAQAAKGNVEGLKVALNEGLDQGLTINEARDALVQLYAYAGFPRSLTALGTLVGVLDERGAAGKHDERGVEPAARPTPDAVRKVGTEIQTRIIGRPASGRVYEFAPEIDTYLKEHLFGDVFSSGILDMETREIVTVSILAALPAPTQLRGHARGALNVGVAPETLREVPRVLSEKVGIAEATLATETINDAINR